jgi:hypothetical protein
MPRRPADAEGPGAHDDGAMPLLTPTDGSAVAARLQIEVAELRSVAGRMSCELAETRRELAALRSRVRTLESHQPHPPAGAPR